MHICWKRGSVIPVVPHCDVGGHGIAVRGVAPTKVGLGLGNAPDLVSILSPWCVGVGAIIPVVLMFHLEFMSGGFLVLVLRGQIFHTVFQSGHSALDAIAE